jgi:hypothetical protein
VDRSCAEICCDETTTPAMDNARRRVVFMTVPVSAGIERTRQRRQKRVVDRSTPFNTSAMVGGGTFHRKIAAMGTTVPTMTSRSPVTHDMGELRTANTMQLRSQNGMNALRFNSFDMTALSQEG